jgi:hypothetical protein
MKLRKPTQNLIVDAAAFVAFALMLATGFVLRYMLPPGSGGPVGAHGGGAREYLTVWGLSRHEWGDLHYWFSLALMALLAVHLILHWAWISSMVRGRAREGSGRRVALGVLGLVGVIALIAAPLLSPVEQHQRERAAPQQDRRAPEAPLAPPADGSETPDTSATSERRGEGFGPGLTGERRQHRIRGVADFIDEYSFLAEAAARCGYSPAEFIRMFDLPAATGLRTRLGRLEAAGALSVEEVRALCAERDP